MRVWLIYDEDEFLDLQWRESRAHDRAIALGATHVNVGDYDGNLAGRVDNEILGWRVIT